MNKHELMNIKGGATLSGTLINAIVRIINTFMDLGRSVGSAFNYWKNKKTC